MFDDLKKLKKKGQSLVQGEDISDLTIPESLDIDQMTGSAKDSVKKGLDTTTDSAKRAAGKVKGTFTVPRTETKKGLLKDETHFFCTDCGVKLGPMETKKWKNALKALLGGGATVAGVVLVNPILIFKGATTMTSLKKNDSGMIAKLKGDSKLKDEARNFLVQCEYCGEWVCSKCYLAEKIICNRCASEKGVLDELMDTNGSP